MAAATTLIDRLPVEILAHVLSFLDSPPPSDLRLHDQPSKGMLESGDTNLKNASLVSKRWRSTALSLLFRHIVWPLDRWDLLLSEQEDEPASSVPLVSFLRDNELGLGVRTFTMLVGDSISGFFSYRKRGGERSSVYSRALSEVDGRVGIRMADGSISRATAYGEDNNWLWKMLFGVMDPLRFTLIASPRMLTSLLSRMLFLGDAWSFNVPYHILSLSRKDRSRSLVPTSVSNLDARTEGEGGKGQDANSRVEFSPGTASSTGCGATDKERVPCDLFTIRPWVSLVLNEGSSTPVYRSYEYFHKRPPSILGALLGAEEFPNDEPLVPASIRELAYIAIFPLSSHFNVLLKHLPRVDRLFVQLVPRNDILNDRDEMKNVDTHDLWMERNTSYSMLMNEMLQIPQEGNWPYLREFESGDAADREAWEMAVRYIRIARGGWRVGGDGIFIRQDPNDSDAADSESFGSETTQDSDDSDSDIAHEPLLSVLRPLKLAETIAGSHANSARKARDN